MTETNAKRPTRSVWLALWVAGLACGAALPAGAQQSSGSDGDVVTIDGAEWSTITSASIPWAEADEFCDDLEAGGFSDWRLPTLTELEALHDPSAPGSMRAAIDLADCCAWSSMNLEDLTPERKGQLPDPGGPPAGYYWGYMFQGDISYYSNGRFPDGLALCTRGPERD